MKAEIDALPESDRVPRFVRHVERAVTNPEVRALMEKDREGLIEAVRDAGLSTCWVLQPPARP